MTLFKVLTWNLENTGRSKQVVSETGAARASYIAEVVNSTKANIVVFQEAVGEQNLVATIAYDLLYAIRKATRSDTWTSSNTLPAAPGSPRLREKVWFFWNESEVVPVTLSDHPLEILGGNAANDFPATSGKLSKDGRRAFFIVFKIKGLDSNSCALVTTYHAPFGTNTNLNPQIEGLNSLATMLNPEDDVSIFNVYGLYQYAENYIFMLCGDYNIDICTRPQVYNEHLTSKTNTSPAVMSKTTLKAAPKRKRDDDPQDVQDYLSSGYDNIFYSRSQNVQATDANVVDLLLETQRNETLKAIAEGILSTGTKGRTCNPNIQNTDESFQFYRWYISDHLPVFATFNVT
jgi:hypothetical protein